MAKQEQHLWVKHMYPLDLGESHITLLVLFCTWGRLTKRLSVFSFFFFYFFSLFSTCFPSLSLVPTLFFWPQKEIKGSVSLAVSFSLQAAEREAEDIAGHMGPRSGALMTEWDSIPCYGADSQPTTYSYTDTLIKFCRWRTQAGMHTCCLYGGFRGTCWRLKHMFTTAEFPCTHLYPPPPKPNTGPKARSRTKINVGKQTKQEDTGRDETGRDQQWKKNLLWTNQHWALLQIFGPSLPVCPLWSSFPQLRLIMSFILLVSRHRYDSQKPDVHASFYICSALQPINSVYHMHKNALTFLSQALCIVNGCFRALQPLQFTAAHKQDDSVGKVFIVSLSFFDFWFFLLVVYPLIEAWGDFRQMGHKTRGQKGW